jgi:hypothetical protein
MRLVTQYLRAGRLSLSNKDKGIVGKLQYAYTGPWKITQALDGASYELESVHTPGKREKKHAADLSPYPIELIAFQPLDGADNRYGQINKPIAAEPFASAGLKGFYPSNPYQLEATAASNLLTPIEPFHWPTLSELNDELDQRFWVQDWDY